MAYFVSEDLIGASEVKIHNDECMHVKTRGNTETIMWHGPHDQKEAERVAEIFSGEYCKGWGNAECCMTKS